MADVSPADGDGVAKGAGDGHGDEEGPGEARAPAGSEDSGLAKAPAKGDGEPNRSEGVGGVEMQGSRGTGDGGMSEPVNAELPPEGRVVVLEALPDGFAADWAGLLPAPVARDPAGAEPGGGRPRSLTDTLRPSAPLLPPPARVPVPGLPAAPELAPAGLLPGLPERPPFSPPEVPGGAGAAGPGGT